MERPVHTGPANVAMERATRSLATVVPPLAEGDHLFLWGAFAGGGTPEEPPLIRYLRGRLVGQVRSPDAQVQAALWTIAITTPEVVSGISGYEARVAKRGGTAKAAAVACWLMRQCNPYIPAGGAVLHDRVDDQSLGYAARVLGQRRTLLFAAAGPIEGNVQMAPPPGFSTIATTDERDDGDPSGLALLVATRPADESPSSVATVECSTRHPASDAAQLWTMDPDPST